MSLQATAQQQPYAVQQCSQMQITFYTTNRSSSLVRRFMSKKPLNETAPLHKSIYQLIMYYHRITVCTTQWRHVLLLHTDSRRVSPTRAIKDFSRSSRRLEIRRPAAARCEQTTATWPRQRFLIGCDDSAADHTAAKHTATAAATGQYHVLWRHYTHFLQLPIRG